MALIEKKEGETVFDLMLRTAGAISATHEFLKINNLTSLEIPAGIYKAATVINQDIVDEYTKNEKNNY
jgi:hypothetical protein